MTRIDYQWYWDLANKVAGLSTEVANQLQTLDGSLDVSNSAGTHTSAGHTWGMAYDQSASDIFELASLTSIAAGNLAEMVHQAGANHANAENSNAPESPVEVPGVPAGSGLEHAKHPTGFSSGGIDDKPWSWWLVEEYVTKKWADPDTGKIMSAGSAFATMSGALGNITIPETTPDDPPPDVGPINGAVDRLFTALSEVTFACDNMNRACSMTASASDHQRDAIRDVLNAAVGVYMVTATLPRMIPYFRRRALDMIKRSAAASVDRILIELDALITGPPEGQVGGPYPPSGSIGVLGSPNPIDNSYNQRGGTYASATSAAQNQLAPLLGRYARQVNKARVYDFPDQVRRMGQDGERRAVGSQPQREITINGNVRRPDLIDDNNRQVVEVKNKSSLSLPPAGDPDKPDNDLNQVRDTIDYAKSQGYTAVLVVDHRTQLPAEVQELARNGELTVVRQELYDGMAWDPNKKEWAEPEPFIPREDWTVPDPRQTQPYTGVPTR